MCREIPSIIKSDLSLQSYTGHTNEDNDYSIISLFSQLTVQQVSEKILNPL